jgi:hypothetical protein
MTLFCKAYLMKEVFIDPSHDKNNYNVLLTITDNHYSYLLFRVIYVFTYLVTYPKV